MKKTLRPDTLNSKLAAYSASAVAALLIAPAAEAVIVNIVSPTVSMDVPQNGGLQSLTLHFGPFHGVLKGYNFTRSSGSGGYVSFRNGHFAAAPFHYLARDFAPGVSPIAGNPLGFDPSVLVARHTYATFSPGPGFATGNFVPGANGQNSGYVGFKTQNVNGVYYGWLRVRVTGDSRGNPIQISLVALNGVIGAFGLAGDGITAGQLAAIPEPANVAGGLALLALGAVGVREHQRRKLAP